MNDPTQLNAFACAAMTALLRNTGHAQEMPALLRNTTDPAELLGANSYYYALRAAIAAEAYRIAEAMMEARAEPHDGDELIDDLLDMRPRNERQAEQEDARARGKWGDA